MKQRLNNGINTSKASGIIQANTVVGILMRWQTQVFIWSHLAGLEVEIKKRNHEEKRNCEEKEHVEDEKRNN